MLGLNDELSSSDFAVGGSWINSWKFVLRHVDELRIFWWLCGFFKQTRLRQLWIIQTHQIVLFPSRCAFLRDCGTQILHISNSLLVRSFSASSSWSEVQSLADNGLSIFSSQPIKLRCQHKIRAAQIVKRNLSKISDTSMTASVSWFV